MRLQELFKQPNTEWKWGFRGSEEAEAEFVVGDVEYRFYAYTDGNTEGSWEVEFKAIEGVDPGNRYGLTGTGNSAHVLSTVVDILRSFLEQYKSKIHRLVFTAKESSRRELYARMVRRLLPEWKFTLTGRDFFLDAPDVASKLTESTEEDRAIISLSSAIYDYLQKYAQTPIADNKQKKLGKIGNLFDTPVQALQNINLVLLSDEGIFKRTYPGKTRDDVGVQHIIGAWEDSTDSILLNQTMIISNSLRTNITHELRHALDDIKSDYKAGYSSKYFDTVVGNKEHTYQNYLGQKGEINARFAEVMHGVIPSVRRSYGLPPDQIKRRIFNDLMINMEKKHLIDVFKDGKNSPGYKRLIKRAIDMIEKEMAHHEKLLAQAGRPKHATGGW